MKKVLITTLSILLFLVALVNIGLFGIKLIDYGVHVNDFKETLQNELGCGMPVSLEPQSLSKNKHKNNQNSYSFRSSCGLTTIDEIHDASYVINGTSFDLETKSKFNSIMNGLKEKNLFDRYWK